MSCERPRAITCYTQWCDEYGCLKKGDMDVVGGCFGLRYVKREERKQRIGDLIEVFIEDDEAYHFKMSFDEHWLDDLMRLLMEAKRNEKR